MVSVMMEVFSLGGIQVLIGTNALLGEGWDAPIINALIIASYVSTFILPNQMRGRAIRTELGNPLKTANIWHLVCVDPVDNPGYLLFRKSSKRLIIRYDYHNVLKEMARSKEYSELFLKEWNQKIGGAELIYTRIAEGGKVLLTARMKAMSAIFVSKSDRISAWR